MIGKYPRGLIYSLMLLCSFVTSSFSSFVVAETDPIRATQLLGEMSQALREKNYQGLFTYEHGGSLETLKVMHQVSNGVEVSSVEHLNGPAHYYSPQARKTDCLSPSDQLLRGSLIGVQGSLSDLSQHYRFYIRDDQRIAGREAYVVQAIPMDKFRFGHSFSIDKLTSLPLGMMTFTPSKKVLERLQFVDMQLLEVVEPIAVSADNVECPQALSDSIAWNIQWLPSGFIAVGTTTGKAAGDMVMFTDGLSSFSVFVRPSVLAVVPQGQAQRGATIAYMQQSTFSDVPHTVGVVGELPAVAAQRIAASVTPKLIDLPVQSDQPQAISNQ